LKKEIKKCDKVSVNLVIRIRKSDIVKINLKNKVRENDNIKVDLKSKMKENDNVKVNRLIVGSGFGSNYWNRLDSTIPTLEIDSKFNLICANLESTRFNSNRYSISILEIESNCQEIENNVIMSRVTILRFM